MSIWHYISGIHKGKLVVSEEVERLVPNCHSYFCESNGTQCSRKKNNQSPKDKILQKGKVMKIGEHQRKPNLFTKIDAFWKMLIRHKIYGFYQNKIASTLDMFLSKLHMEEPCCTRI